MIFLYFRITASAGILETGLHRDGSHSNTVRPAGFIGQGGRMMSFLICGLISEKCLTLLAPRTVVDEFSSVSVHYSQCIYFT